MTELFDDLRGDGPWIVLCPTDEAFRRLPPGVRDGLTRPRATEALVDVAELHVAYGEAPAGDAHLISLLGIPLTVDSVGKVAGGAARVMSRTHCLNGTILAIDRVLFPPTLLSPYPRPTASPRPRPPATTRLLPAT